MIESPKLKQAGAKWFHTKDHGGGLNLTRTVLGEFMYEMLSRGVQIGNFFALAKSPRAFVQASVFMTEEMKTSIEKETRFKFQNPPKIHIN